jgi:hypothetical protein
MATPRGTILALALLLVSSSFPAPTSATFSKDDSKCEWRSVIDNFDGGENYANNDGTHPFASSWKESDPHGGGASSGSVQVRHTYALILLLYRLLAGLIGLKALGTFLFRTNRAASSIC